ncbi:MAG: hypothetical protein K6T91_05575 [Firmicutes bacterium]|nr:hypothetical protein [Bacillota bacterium]
MDKQLNLEEIVLIGRTFDEYRNMFALDEELLKSGPILDVASGVSSFCAEANSKGYNVVASDKIYTLSPSKIEDKCKQDLDDVIKQLPAISDLYVWNYFKDIQALKDQRERAYKLFIKDFKLTGIQRYVPAEYPITDFHDYQFTVSLVSGFLFLYENHLNYEFHKRTLLELARVTSKEIRIFPITNLKGKPSVFLEPIMRDEELHDLQMQIKRVDYEFLRNANEMLVVKVHK